METGANPNDADTITPDQHGDGDPGFARLRRATGRVLPQ
jgi:hypothetical protein